MAVALSFAIPEGIAMNIGREELWSAAFVFSQRKTPLSARHRLSWRIPLLLLMLGIGSRAQRSSVLRLHLLNTALSWPDYGDAILVAMESQALAVPVPLFIEPGFSRTIDFAEGVGMVDRLDARRLVLTEAGEAYLSKITTLTEIFAEEREFLARARSIATEGRVQQILHGGTRR